MVVVFVIYLSFPFSTLFPPHTAASNHFEAKKKGPGYFGQALFVYAFQNGSCTNLISPLFALSFKYYLSSYMLRMSNQACSRRFSELDTLRGLSLCISPSLTPTLSCPPMPQLPNPVDSASLLFLLSIPSSSFSLLLAQFSTASVFSHSPLRIQPQQCCQNHFSKRAKSLSGFFFFFGNNFFKAYTSFITTNKSNKGNKAQSINVFFFCLKSCSLRIKSKLLGFRPHRALP